MPRSGEGDPELRSWSDNLRDEGGGGHQQAGDEKGPWGLERREGWKA